MEKLIQASKAFKMTKSAAEEKYDEAIRTINDGILAAAKNGANEVTVFFDSPLLAFVEDRIAEALEDAGYHIESWQITDITISWSYPEADEPSTQSTAADVDTNTAAGTEVVNESTAVCDDKYDDYNNYVKVPLGYIRDWIHNSMYYQALTSGGVENWDWYSEAISEFCREEDARDMDEVINQYMQSCLKSGIIIK